MTRTAAAVLLLTSLAGCNSTQLRFTTLRQGNTVPDIQQKQVLENLARLAANPGALPYFNLLASGTANITDRGSAMFDFKAVPHEFTDGKYGFDAERAITGNWSIVPLNDPNRLAAIRAACLIALGRGREVSRIDFHRLVTLLCLNYPNPDPYQVIPIGWVCTGDAHPGKHCEPYVARYDLHGRKLYAWVPPRNLKAFADFCLIIMDLATLSDSRVPRILPKLEEEPAKPEESEEARELTSEIKTAAEHYEWALRRRDELTANRLKRVTPDLVDSVLGPTWTLQLLPTAREAELGREADQWRKVQEASEQALAAVRQRDRLEAVNRRLREAAEPGPLPSREIGIVAPFNPGLFFVPRP